MNIENFLNPVEEVVQDSPEELEQHIIAQLEPEGSEDEDEHAEIEPLITLTTALSSLQMLRLFEEQQDKGDIELQVI
ncbi:hypothetical protein ACJ73_07913 [Blastomyces percursus]|uniref:Uncharacterized protein n=1 Tax=Blastomyces percursus TaxID=1658174 RepID=A0A1J9PWS6_9EURO|nr:hypothetical protein ACJ73_07913 [Blastomyces percursus]